MNDQLKTALKKLSYCLKFYRRLRDCSQSELASRAGVSFRNYQRLENGEVLPRVDTLVRLAQELKLPISTLLEIDQARLIELNDVSDKVEREIFREILGKPPQTDMIKLVRAILEFENNQPGNEKKYAFELSGGTSVIDHDFQNFLGLQNGTVSMDDHTVGIRVVDFWEHVYRSSIREIRIVTLHRFPRGFVFIEGHHVILNSNPDAARSVGYTIDRTNRYQLEKWLSDQVSGYARAIS